jgi:hypothetical protein
VREEEEEREGRRVRGRKGRIVEGNTKEWRRGKLLKISL